MSYRKKAGLASAIAASLLLVACSSDSENTDHNQQDHIQQEQSQDSPDKDSPALEVFNKFQAPDDWVEQSNPNHAGVQPDDQTGSFGMAYKWEIPDTDSIPTVDQLHEIVDDNANIFESLEHEYVLEDVDINNNSTASKVVIDDKEYALIMFGWQQSEGVQAYALLTDYQEAENNKVFDRYQKI